MNQKQQNPRRYRRFGLSLILLLFTILGLFYDFTVPLFEKPDELKHFAVIQFIASQRALPVVRPGIYKAWDQEGTQPPLYHILAALLVSGFDLSHFEEPERNPHYVDDRSFVWRERGNNNLYLHPPGENGSGDPLILAARLARWLSLLAGLGTILLTYLLARIIFVDQTVSTPSGPVKSQSSKSGNDGLTRFPPSEGLPLLAAALVAFIPQFLHVSSAITNDSLSVTLAAAALVLLALIIKQGWNSRYAILLGGILGLGALTKLSLLYLCPLAGLILLLEFYRHRSLTRLVKFGLILGILMLGIAGWWYWRNWQLYGDISALNAHLLYRGGPLNPRPSLVQILQTERVGLELTFWAAFGAGQILWEPWLYRILSWLKYLILLGLLFGFWRQWQGLKSERQYRNQPGTTTHPESFFSLLVNHRPALLILALLLLWSLIIFAALLRWMQITPASWGRLLFPTLPALAPLAAWSLSQFIFLPPLTSHASRFTPHVSRFTSHVSRLTSHASRLTLFLLPSLLLLLAVISPFRYIQAAYAKTPLVEETVLPPDIQPLGFVYDQAFRLVGYRLEKTSVQPGEWLPVTLYWQALQPIEKNYSAFVHLLDPQGRAIGQANTYPDGGNWPTSMLEPGKILADTYYVPVSPEVEAPLMARLAMGIFEFEDPERRAKVAVNAEGEVIEPVVEGVPVLPWHWPELHPSQRLEANFGNQIRLIGYDWVNDQKIEPGKTLPLTLYWETLQPPGQDLNLFIHLLDPATGAQVAGFDGPPAFPTGQWQPGNTFIDIRTLPLPADLPPGDYELRIGWYNLTDFSRLPLQERAGDSLLLSRITLSGE